MNPYSDAAAQHLIKCMINCLWKPNICECLSSVWILFYFTIQLIIECSKYIFPLSTVQDKLSRKRRFVEGQSLDGSPLTSLSDYPYGSDPPVSSSPSCEVVPVICHVTTTGNNKFPSKTSCDDKSFTFNAEVTRNITEANKRAKDPPYHGYPPTSHGLDNSLLDQFFESAQSKQDKLLVDLSESSLSSVPDKTGNHFNCSSDILELPKSTDSTDQCVCNSHTMSKDVPSKTEYSLTGHYGYPQKNRCDGTEDTRCVSDIGSIHSFNSFDSSKGEHLVKILSNTFNDKRSYRTSSCLEDRPHLGGQFATENCPETPPPMCLDNSSSTGMKEMTCDKCTSDSDAWHEIAQPYEQKSLFEGKPAEILTAEKMIEEEPPRTVHAESCEFSKLRSAVYQGQLHYQEHRHSMADSSDSDSDRACPVSTIEVKNSSSGLQTVDITEISLAPSQPCKSPGERSAHPFQCSMCDRAFSQRGSLNRHMRSHLGVRPYSCPQCSMTFSRQYRVTEHMRVHQRSCEGPSESRLRAAATGMNV